MTTILNASTSAGLIITPDTSGNIQLQYNGVAAPTFWAWQNANAQSVTSGAAPVKVVFDSTLWNTNGYNASTYVFTPTVAGYYQVVASIGWLGNAVTNSNIYLYKNGSALTDLRFYNANGNNNPIFSGTFLVYLNGTTDNLSIYTDILMASGSSTTIVNNGSGSTPSDRTYFGACLLRGA
jgi:hypothetical protein